MQRAARYVRRALAAVSLLGLALAPGSPEATAAPAPRDGRPAASAQDSRPIREIRIVARKYAFSPQRIEVEENDLVKITIETADVPHSFTIDDENYRIAKRATPGHPAVFEFRADKAGTFTFYCNLTADPGCKGMRGQLVVKRRR